MFSSDMKSKLHPFFGSAKLKCDLVVKSGPATCYVLEPSINIGIVRAYLWKQKLYVLLFLLPTQFTEIAWEKGGVYKAIKRMEVQKSADECRLVAEVLKHVLGSFIDTLVVQFNDLMRMLPKITRAKVPSEHRPIATIRLL